MEIFWLLLIVSVGFFIYTIKRERKIEFEHKNYANSTEHLQRKLEEAADNIVFMIEERNEQLEFLLAEADAKILELDEKIAVLTKNNNINNTNDTNDISFDIEKNEEIKEVYNQEVEELEIETESDFLSGKGQKEQVLLMRSSGESIASIVKKVGLEETAVKLIIEMNK